MTCEPTNVPSPEEIDIPAIQEKYQQERNKRIRPDGQKQYAKIKEEFTEEYLHDPHTPVVSRDPISEDLDVAVLGTGWSGLLSAYHLKNAGITNFRNIDHGGDWGGVWYWNRYPGIQCDNDAYCYLPLLEETGFMPSKKYSDGYEIYDYFKVIAEKYSLGEKALFHTLITGLRWDDNIKRWRISTNRGDEIRARFVIMANGLLNIPKLPKIPGIHDFQGKMFHTSRWEYDYTGGSYRNPVLDKLKDKKVAIIGTGATAIQAIPYLGKYAKQVYVLQRTPSPVDQRNNNPTDPEWAASLQPGWQKERMANFHRAAMEGRFLPGEEDLVGDFWTEITRNLMAEVRAEGREQEISIEEYYSRRDTMDYQVMERMRRRVESLIEDQETSEALKVWYRFLCKRPLSNDDYYDTFNRPNVKLIDVSETQGVERMTENGFVANGEEYDIDCMIFASGFEVTSDLDRRWGIDTYEGRNGISIYDHWKYGYKTLHGTMTSNFPNQFFIGYYQGGLNATTTEQYGRQAYHSTYIIKEALARGLSAVEPSEQAQEAYVQHVRETAVDISAFQAQCPPSYYNNEGHKVKDEDGHLKFRNFLGEAYGPGWDAFEKLLADWREQGDLDGLVTE
ncbi:NAD(P)/FAD-dependent oxidoreductase [Aestuariicella hydrocarbonica]|uniref:NAD(P)/FAD-dependent oxidoreductase n=1 Tax=Pseudomaricurvus hydrocarbonicus TaxID=1470433 RepID=A0A9E5JWY6_9GAMM|nr:NAD(P)/FAD-dependent oxidoreductase [Aestuariicella hydrocarbonica]NHO66015.1 NAD(P)/FAD-dependent oxidoreductase [Aestuariicella hydrocarbonica]